MAIGAGATTSALGVRAIAIGNLSQSNQVDAIAIGTQALASAGNTVAIGTTAQATGATSVAIGQNAQSTNSNTLAIGADTVAGTLYATAIGRGANASGQSAIAIGGGNAGAASIANGAGAIAIGGGVNGVGAAPVASSAGSIALGTGATAGTTAGDVAIGRFSATAAAVPTGSAVINGITFPAFAGSAPSSVVSFGNTTLQRQLTNVAAGQVTVGSTDAINGSQLFSTTNVLTTRQATLAGNVASALGGGSTVTTGGGVTIPSYTFAGTTYTGVGPALTALGQTFNLRSNGDTATQVAPGATVAVNNGTNIAVTRSGSTLTIGTTPALTADSLTINGGGPVLNATGLRITGGPSLTTTGISAGGLAIANVANGVAPTDAVNRSQLDAVSGAAYSGWVIAGPSVVGRVASGRQVSFLAGNNATSVAVAQAAGDSTVTVSAAPGAVRYTAGNNPAGGNAPSDPFTPTNQATLVGAGGATSGGVVLNNVGAGAVNATSLQAINGSQLFNTASNVATALGGGSAVTPQGGVTLPSYTFAGTTYTGIGPALTALGQTFNLRSNGDTATQVAPGATVAVDNGTNIAVTRSGSTLTIGTTPALTADSLTINGGGPVLNATGLRITGGPSLTTTGISAGGLAIANVANGVAPTDAVNVSQLRSSAGELAALGLSFTANDRSAGDVQRALGQTLAIVGAGTTPGAYSGANLRTRTDPGTGTIALEMSSAPQFGNVTVNAGGSGRITGLSAGIAPNDAVNVAQLASVSAAATAGWNLTTTATGTGTAQGSSVQNIAPGATMTVTAGNNVAITQSGSQVTVAVSATPRFAGMTTGGLTVTPGSSIDLGGNVLTNVAAGVNATDGVNVAQLNALTTSLGGRSPVQYTDVQPGQTVSNSARLVGLDAPVVLHNVAAGVAATDAANVSQLPGAWSAAQSNTFVFGNPAAGSAPVVLSNVAAGAISPNSTEAVNGSQLYATNRSINNLASYVGSSLLNLENQMGKNRREANSGVAQAMALGMIRYDDRPGKFSLGIAGGAYQQQGGIAVGAGYTSMSQNARFSGGVTFSPSDRKTGVGGGLSATFTLN